MRRLLLLVLGLLLISSVAHAADIRIIPPEPTEQDHVMVELSGTWRNSCVPESPQVIQLGSSITINLSSPEGPCLAAETDWEEKVRLGKLSAGTYRVDVKADGETLGRERFEVTESVKEFFQPGVYGPDEVEAGGEFDVRFEVENTGEDNGSQEIELHRIVDDEMGTRTTETITLDPGDVWVKEETHTADAESYEFKLITADGEASKRVEVTDGEEKCELEMTAYEGGTTEPDPGTHGFSCGETLEVEAVSAEGWQFTLWERSGSATTCDQGENLCVFEIDQDTTFAAHFAEEDNGYQPPASREVNVEVLPEDAQKGDSATIHVYGNWENGCAPQYSDHSRPLSHVLRVETINRSETCLMAVTDFSLFVDIDDLPPVLRVETYYESPPNDQFLLIASEDFSFSD